MAEHPLTAFRRERDLTMEALGAAVGVNKTTISRIESGEYDASLRLVRRLVEFADGALSADDFLGRQPPQHAETAS